jgi:ligand-binding SRPBCC domain-containing protein
MLCEKAECCILAAAFFFHLSTDTGLYTLDTTQKIPADIEAVWDFMSSPANLKHITPDYMGFDILTPDLPEKMYPGMIIAYHVTPLFGIKMKWVTEITHVSEHRYFVDEQRIGPYRMWHHEHHIEKIPGGVLMHDRVSYQPPFGILGDFAQTLFIKRQLAQIFDYRTRKIGERFGMFTQTYLRPSE